jgi:hypothetical protein
MSKRILLFIVAVSMISIFSSCKKDSSGNTIIPGITTSMTAKINGSGYNNVDWISMVRVCNKSGNSITLIGTALDGSIFELNITPNVSSESLAVNKEYTLPLTSCFKKTASTTQDDIYFVSPFPVSSVKLTQLDLTNKLISGTFSFTGVSLNLGTISVTSGAFTSLSYIGN